MTNRPSEAATLVLIWNALLAMALLLGTAASIHLLLPALEQLPCPGGANKGLGCAEDWLNRYQTLATGVLALVGALLTVGAVRRQIDQVERIEIRRRRGEEDAARAALPIALSQVTEYARSCVHALMSLDLDEDDIDLTHFLAPAVPTGVIEPLQACIRHAGPTEAQQIGKVLGWLQIQSTRLASLAHDTGTAIHVVTASDIAQAMVDAAKLHALASTRFDYARGGYGGTPITVAGRDILSALRQCHLWDEEFPPDLQRIIEAEDRRAGNRVT